MNKASARYPRTSGCCCKEKLINFCMTESVALEKIFTTSARVGCTSRVNGSSDRLAHAGKLNAYHLVISMPCTCRWQATNFVVRLFYADYRVGSQFTNPRVQRPSVPHPVASRLLSRLITPRELPSPSCSELLPVIASRLTRLRALSNLRVQRLPVPVASR